MKVSIQRSTGLQTYEVPPFAETMTVMAILDYIYQNLDHSLAYYRHSSCCQAACGRCRVRLNGVSVLACAKEVLPDTQEIVLTPASDRIVRDLVIEP